MLSGDFNTGDINWELGTVLSNSNQKAVNELVLNISQQFDLTQLQREPAGESNLLDLFFTNKPTLVKNVSAIPGISDHEIVLADCNIKPTINKRAPCFIHQWRKADWEKLKSETITFGKNFIAGAASRSVSENNNFSSNMSRTRLINMSPRDFSKSVKITSHGLRPISAGSAEKNNGSLIRPNVLIVVRTGRSTKTIRNTHSSLSGAPTGIILIPYSRTAWNPMTQSHSGVTWSPISRTQWVCLL